MNDDTIADLKQFITTTMRQEVSVVKDDIISDIKQDIADLDVKLSSKIDDLSQSVADAMDLNSEDVDKQIDNHEQRITKLEAKVA